MANLRYEVYHFPAGETGSYNISDAVDVMSDDGLNVQAGTYTFTVSNKGARFKDDLKYGDKVKISLGDDASTKQIIYGKIEDEEYEYSTGRITKTIKGYGPGRELQNFLVNQIIQSGGSYTAGDYTYTYAGINTATVVKYLTTEFINSESAGKVTIDVNTYVDVNSGCKPWAETIGSDFNKSWVNTSPNKIFDEIRSDAFTGAGDYDFYIDNDDYLHFEPRGSGAAYFTLIEGSNILDYKLKRNIKPKYTAIMVFCGEDERGVPLLRAGYNSEGISQYGYKWGFHNAGWLWRNVSGNNAGVLSVADIRDATLSEGKAIATAMAETQGLPKWTADVTLKGTTQFILASGQCVNVSFPSASQRFNPGSLILTDVKHNFNNRGWTTTLKLEENAGEIF